MTKIINQTLYRLGIVFYLLWALIHLLVPFQIFFETAGSMAEGIETGASRAVGIFHGSDRIVNGVVSSQRLV